MNMIEKVAKAIRIYENGTDNGWGMTRNIGLAKAAIEAMKEPSDELMYILENDGYDAMIAAALK